MELITEGKLATVKRLECWRFESWPFVSSLWPRANAQNVSTRTSLRWPIYLQLSTPLINQTFIINLKTCFSVMWRTAWNSQLCPGLFQKFRFKAPRKPISPFPFTIFSLSSLITVWSNEIEMYEISSMWRAVIRTQLELQAARRRISSNI